MGKSETKAAKLLPAKKTDGTKDVISHDVKPKKKGGGWGEIQGIFDAKKKQVSEEKASITKQKADRKRQYRSNDAPSSSKSNDQQQEHQADIFARSTKPGSGTSQSQQWMDDGLGGKFNTDGYTGRVEDGVKIFKAHVLSKQNAGSTQDCPFDCTCCYI